MHAHAFVFMHIMQAAERVDIPLVLGNSMSLGNSAAKQIHLSCCWCRCTYLCMQFCVYIL